MQMTVGEIQRNYEQAKDKEKQIGILADLNCCSREEIKNIVGVESKRREQKISEPKYPKSTELSRGEILERLFGRLDLLDHEIKKLEEEYRKVYNAIEVLGTLGQKG